MDELDRSEDHGSARYVYAVIPRVAREDFGAIGIANARVYTMARRDIAAVVHNCPPEPYQGDPETVAGWVKIHNDVIDAAWGEAGSVLPMRFDVIIKGDSEHSAEENTRRWLAAEYSTLKAKLEEFRGKVELSVQVLWDPAVIARRIMESSEEIGQLRAEMATKSRGAAYFIEQKIARAVKAEMEGKAQRDFAACYERLKEWSEDVHVNKPRKQADRAVMANFSLLVRRTRAQEIVQLLRHMNDEPGVEVRVTGPWPPYTFAATVGAVGGRA